MVNDAWRLAPDADVLYANEASWWNVSGPSAQQFTGERWSSHNPAGRVNDDKLAAAATHGLRLIDGATEIGFCMTPGRIHYGDNSGFQAINLALQFGAVDICLLGFDMHHTSKRHFFGDHPPECAKDSDYRHFIGHFENAARQMPEGVTIVNATPGSALTCFPGAQL